MDYYERRVKAFAEINKWLGSYEPENTEEMKKSYKKLTLSIVLNYGFSEKFVEKYLKLRLIKIDDGVIEYE
jgi:hypothetical protein